MQSMIEIKLSIMNAAIPIMEKVNIFTFFVISAIDAS